ncbi:sterol desaturase family protein [Flexithrix dorotheae]|uniref:sterol desaturase family protein n=1 Tax=Flexithrix dorotheae TaxID=70993 RepID=UPI00035F42DF|nr:sterol desaturase family protein [Flexithrix dorotheae]
MENLPINEYITYIYPFLILTLVSEFIFARENYILKETLSSFAIAIGATIVASFTKIAALVVFTFVFEATKEFRLELLGYESLGWAWYIWILAIIGDDFNFYWHHRFSHTIRLLWAAHIPHHNSETFNFSVALRNGWFITLYKPIYWLWMPLIGFEPVMVATALIINAIFQFFLHTQLMPSLGWFGKIINNPYIHQAHHACNIEYLDKNHGGIFIIWDRIFGTYQDLIKGVKPIYGVLKPPQSFNPIKANTHEFENIWRDVKSTKSFKNKLKYIFYPPGWSPDKSTKTAKEMQRDLVAQ